MASFLTFTPPPEDLDPLELEILRRRGAFAVPPRQISDHLINIFFSWVAPTLPVINQQFFMSSYRGLDNRLSILLLQAVYTIATRFFNGPCGFEDPNLTPQVFYKKAKALYDAGYERDSKIVLQAVVLLSTYWNGPDDLRESGIFYWSHIGIALAQQQRLHTSERYALLEPPEKAHLKRIWWALYTRDRSVAAAFGRPALINLSDCTVEALTEADFIEGDEQLRAVHQPAANQTHARFFLQYIRLCQIMDLGPCLNLASRATELSRNMQAARCELKLHEWLASCPAEFLWRPTSHTIWAALLHSTFHTIVCQLHLVRTDRSPQSQSSAFHSATTIVSILETLRYQNQISYSPTFVICHAVVSLVTLKYQLGICAAPLLHATKLNIEASLNTLRTLSRTWPVATPLHELFQTIVGPDQLSRLVRTAVNSYQHRNHVSNDGEGEREPTRADRGLGLRPPTVFFTKPKLKQVILPQSKIILQITRTETRSCQPVEPSSSLPSGRDYDQQETWGNQGNTALFENKGVCPDNPEPSSLEEALDPETILRTLRQAIEMRGLGGYPTGDFN